MIWHSRINKGNRGERIRIAKTIIKGEEVNYEEKYYFCQNSEEDENEFSTAKMENDNMLRIINENPLAALELLQKNSEQFGFIKKLGIKQKIMENLDEDSREYLQRKALESEYAEFEELSDANGMMQLDIPKIELIISYYASKIKMLYKVKLMKMLWYADSLSYKMDIR